MSEYEAKKTLRLLMDDYGLSDWGVGLSNARRAMGQTSCKKKMIYLSKELIRLAPDHIIINTMRHEIAHAVDYKRRGRSDHGWQWKNVALEVGANPDRLVEENEFTKNIPHKYTYTCECCGTQAHVNRRLKNIDRRFCTICYRKTGRKCRFTMKQHW